MNKRCNGSRVSIEPMRQQFGHAGKHPTPPELHLRASKQTRHDVIAQVMGAAQSAEASRILRLKGIAHPALASAFLAINPVNIAKPAHNSRS
jgi:hypothetical protein